MVPGGMPFHPNFQAEIPHLRNRQKNGNGDPPGYRSIPISLARGSLLSVYLGEKAPSCLVKFNFPIRKQLFQEARKENGSEKAVKTGY